MAEDTNNDIASLSPEQRAEYMAQIKDKLGIPADADDFEVVARLVIFVSQLQQRYDEMLNATAQAQGEMANRDLERYKDVIAPEDATYWHAQLLANREPTLKVLDGIKARLAAKPKVVPMANRTQPVQPRNLGQEPTVTKELNDRALAIANRARAIQHDLALPFPQAWERAAKEIEAANLK